MRDALAEDQFDDFGVCVMAKPDTCAREAQLAEALGFNHIWVADTQLMAGDVFVCLTLIAAATRRAKLGTGVAIAGTRIAPVTACALGSLNQVAPGRVLCGIGTGNSARCAMGLPPCKLRELREHVNVIRGLLAGGEVDYHEGNLRRTVRFFHQQMGFVNLQDELPIYIAANQPKAMELAGEIGDGFITSRTNTVEGWRDAWQRVRRGAERRGRNPADLYTMLLTTAALMRPGEQYDSPASEPPPVPGLQWPSIRCTKASPASSRRRRRCARSLRNTKRTWMNACAAMNAII